ncbi:MAG: hypothetical protein NVSMB63_12400 [Sediminibacterium sp.]
MASAACMNREGVPVEFKVAAIFWATMAALLIGFAVLVFVTLI